VAVRLFIGNLPYGATDAELREHFAAVGAPSQIVMPVDRETGRPRGFAFVDFPDRGVAEEAIRKFDGQPFKGRTLAVSEARAREDRPASRPPAGGFAPRPMRPIDPGIGPPPSRERPGRTFGPDAAPKGRRGPNRAAAGKEKPKGPIRERPGNRVLDLDDDSADEVPDFDNFATHIEHKDDDEKE
jgi:RNA recognition motif-containing protein